MSYIIGGANLANAERPSVNVQAATAAEALQRISVLEAEGYTVRVSSSEGDEVSVDQIRAKVMLEKLAS